LSDIAFDEARHEYSRNGVVLPHVTGVLRDLVDLSMIRPADLEYARERGQATHRAVELWHSPAGLDVGSLSSPVLARFASYVVFLQRTGFVPDLVEYVVEHRELGYAGKLDLYGTFKPGFFDIGPRKAALIDIKTGMVEPVAGPQTAAYQQALMCEVPQAALAERFALWLGENRYTLHPLNDPRDWPNFVNRLIEWKTRN
jgi:hypothetical protein